MTTRSFSFVPTTVEIENFNRARRSVYSPLFLFKIVIFFSAVNLVLWPHGWHALSLVGYLVLLCASALMTVRRRLAQRRYAFLPGGEIEITIDDDAISTDGELAKPEVIRWKNVTNAFHSSSDIIITLEGGSILSIPERAFDGDWAVFWDELRTHLTGARYLILGPPNTNRLIKNTRLRTGV